MAKGSHQDIDDERERLGLKRGNSTMKAALSAVEGRVKDDQLSPLAERLQRIERIKQDQRARWEALRRAREVPGPSGGDAA